VGTSVTGCGGKGVVRGTGFDKGHYSICVVVYAVVPDTVAPVEYDFLDPEPEWLATAEGGGSDTEAEAEEPQQQQPLRQRSRSPRRTPKVRGGRFREWWGLRHSAQRDGWFPVIHTANRICEIMIPVVGVTAFVQLSLSPSPPPSS